MTAMLDRFYCCRDYNTEDCFAIIRTDRVVGIETAEGGYVLLVDWSGTEHAIRKKAQFITRYSCEKPIAVSYETASFWLIDRQAELRAAKAKEADA